MNKDFTLDDAIHELLESSRFEREEKLLIIHEAAPHKLSKALSGLVASIRWLPDPSGRRIKREFPNLTQAAEDLHSGDFRKRAEAKNNPNLNTLKIAVVLPQ